MVEISLCFLVHQVSTVNGLLYQVLRTVRLHSFWGGRVWPKQAEERPTKLLEDVREYIWFYLDATIKIKLGNKLDVFEDLDKGKARAQQFCRC